MTSDDPSEPTSPSDPVGLSAAVAGWPADVVAVGVTDATGTLAVAGPTDKPLPIASVTKPLTALAALVAVEEGTIGLDDSAGPPGATVRHLLAHTSGLAFDQARVLAEPGRRRIYSNVGIVQLSDHIEARAQLPFDVYLREAVFEPLALAGTTMRGSAAAGAWSTVGDLLAVVREMLVPTILAPQTWREATTVQFPEVGGVLPGIGPFSPNPWGLGVEIRGDKDPHWTGRRNSPRTYGHFGGTGTFIWVDPDLSLGCVALTERRFGRWALEAWPSFSDAVIERFGARARPTL